MLSRRLIGVAFLALCLAHAEASSSAQQPAVQAKPAKPAAKAKRKTPSAPKFVSTLTPLSQSYLRRTEPKGVAIGDWRLRVRVRIESETTDNVFFEPNNTADDRIVLARPSFTLSRKGQDIDWTIDGNAFHHYYLNGTSATVTEGGLNAQARIRFEPRHTLTLRTGAQRNVLERSDPNDSGGAQPEEDRVYGEATHYWEMGQFSLRTVLAGTRVDFVANRDNDRDRNLFQASVRGRWAASRELTPYVGLDFTSNSYDDVVDDRGFDRDWDGYGARIGVTWRPVRNFSLRIAGGANGHRFDDPRFSNFTSWAADGGMVWNLARMTSLIVDFARTEHVTTVRGASLRLRSAVDARLEHFFTPEFLGTIGIGYRDDQYQEIARDDDIVTAFAGLDWYASNNTNWFVNYRYTERQSNDPDEVYQVNDVRVGVRLRY